MNRVVFVVCVVLAGVAGFLAGRASVDDAKARGDSRPDFAGGRTERRLVELPADEVAVLRDKAGKYDDRMRRQLEDRKRASRTLEELDLPGPGETPEGTLPPGTRRPDGTIVGGAT